MREIVLDTETTGFEAEDGDRMVEIGCIEIDNLLPTGRVFHEYFNPERPMPQEAFDVHGLGDEFLAKQPLFKSKAQAFLDFIGDAPLVIHNAVFDMRFLNMELKRAGFAPLPMDDKKRVIDTMQVAASVLPVGSQLSLDRVLNYFKIDNSKRTKHGALLDAELLAEAYLHLRGGPNYSLELAVPGENKDTTRHRITAADPNLDLRLVFKPSETELRENKLFREANGFAKTQLMGLIHEDGSNGSS